MNKNQKIQYLKEHYPEVYETYKYRSNKDNAIKDCPHNYINHYIDQVGYDRHYRPNQCRACRSYELSQSIKDTRF